MAVYSMTGYANAAAGGSAEAGSGDMPRGGVAVELRSVNGKGLDLRLRLPPGLERMEAEVRRLAGESFSRGNLQASLSVTADENRFEAVLNRNSTTFREMPDAQKQGIDEAKARALILANTNLIKRPVLEVGGSITTGFRPAAWEALLPAMRGVG